MPSTNMPSPTPTSDRIVIVGSGTAGTTMAIALAQDGHHVTVVERSLEPPKRIVGEVLHPGGLEVLKELGLEDCLISSAGVYFNGLAINDCASGRQGLLPFPDGLQGMTFYNYNFLKVMRQKAQESCAYIEGSAEEVIEEDGVVKGVIIRRKGQTTKEEFRAKLTVIADGPFSRLRKVREEDKPVKQGTIIALTFKGYLPTSCCGPLAAGNGYLVPVFFTNGTAAFVNYMNEGTIRYSTNVPGAWPSDERAFIKEQLGGLNAELRELIMGCIDDVPIHRAHVFELSAREGFRPGVVTIGDALNIRSPSTSAGMTVALKDVILWRDLLRDITCLDDVDQLRAAHKAFMSRRKSYSIVCNLNARAFHDVMFPSNEEMLLARSCVLDYLASSKKARQEMAMVLAIKDTRPLMLLYHLGMANLLTAYKVTTKGSSWWSFPSGLLGGATVLVRSLATLLPLLWNEVRP